MSQGKSFNTGLKTASQQTGIERGRKVPVGRIFHDLRRTFKTYMRKAKVDKTVRDSILGHANIDTDSRYNIIDIEDRQKAIKELETYR
jgi:integrase